MNSVEMKKVNAEEGELKVMAKAQKDMVMIKIIKPGFQNNLPPVVRIERSCLIQVATAIDNITRIKLLENVLVRKITLTTRLMKNCPKPRKGFTKLNRIVSCTNDQRILVNRYI